MESIDKIKVAAALLLVGLGVAGFYVLPVDQGALRSLSVVAGLLLAAAVLWFSQPGRDFVEYARDSVKEAQKVVWPTRKETWQITGVVFLFVGVLALFMWAVDSALAKFFYDIVLGRG
ncbi:preprotein translocase subunit SecE [Andreprevotia lacus DSM 23236]|jgi:preprotein translocase subunit SecE|uniref:Protein translocase subunit SecE n=1 Tax=Andreprevotia lacus DSM 23236 TaxID=1121001 RepID=A0A1W1Y254_9NEIS|nr:preprotein translocase subunit SecE [Andreprevotia lacus]SMC29871.1 preprotein translocase subunit SecE [Andreprevotia lacus DSM 23236]